MMKFIIKLAFLVLVLTSSFAAQPLPDRVTKSRQIQTSNLNDLDLDELIEAVENAGTNLRSALVVTSSKLATVLATHSDELATIQNMLNSAILGGSEELIRFVVIAPFLDLEQLGSLLQNTLISIVNLAKDFELQVRKIVVTSLIFLLPDIVGIAAELVLNVVRAMRPVIDILGFLIPSKDVDVAGAGIITDVSMNMEETGSTTATTASAKKATETDDLISLIGMVLGLNVPKIVAQVPVTFTAINSTFSLAALEVNNLLMEMSSTQLVEEIQEAIETSISMSKEELIHLLVITPFLNFQQLQASLQETIDALDQLSSNTSSQIHGILKETKYIIGTNTAVVGTSSNYDSEFTLIFENFNAGIRNALGPLLKLLRPILSHSSYTWS